jgi:Phage integrase, N-terminal SAM-like domain
MTSYRKTAHPGIDERRDSTGRVRYRVRVRRRGITKTATLPTLAKAIEWRDQALAALDGLAEMPERPRTLVANQGKAATVADAARQLMRGIKAGTIRTNKGQLYKPGTMRRYEESLRVHVVPRIGLMPIGALRRGDVQRFVDELAADTTSPTARKALTALRVALRQPVADEDIPVNPCTGVRVPSDPEGEKPARILTPEESNAIIDAAYEEDAALGRPFAGPLFVLLFGTGARLGEARGLLFGQHGVNLDATSCGCGRVPTPFRTPRSVSTFVRLPSRSMLAGTSRSPRRTRTG